MTAPILLWFRRDLRLADHPALWEAAASGRPVIPVFLFDEGAEALGAAPRMRIGMSVGRLAADLAAGGSRLILRRGPAAEALGRLAEETGAGAVWLTRLHDPASRATDRTVKAALGDRLELRAFPGQLLHDPDALRTGTGGHYRVYTPFSKALMRTDPGAPLPAPGRIPAPVAWPASDRLEDWRLDAPMNRGAAVVAPFQAPGEAGARGRLDRLMAERIDGYARDRDHPGRTGYSGLSENLTHGEISPRTVWSLARAAEARGAEGAGAFLKELAWRDFCHHLLWHEPRVATESWKPGFERLDWSEGGAPAAEAWRRGMTGFPLVDAGMREMWVTGRMHNRVRMVVASLLTKHLLTDWRVGAAHFADCLTDWDPANNAVNWQWVAGSGPDAAPFFRIYNPVGQAEQWDADGAYVRTWVAEGQRDPPPTALAFFDAVPRSWGLSPRAAYPAPILDLAQGREAALAAFRSRIRDGEGAQSGEG